MTPSRDVMFISALMNSFVLYVKKVYCCWKVVICCSHCHVTCNYHNCKAGFLLLKLYQFIWPAQAFSIIPNKQLGHVVIYVYVYVQCTFSHLTKYSYLSYEGLKWLFGGFPMKYQTLSQCCLGWKRRTGMILRLERKPDSVCLCMFMFM